MIYTVSMVRKLLADYQRRAQGARMRPPVDRLGTRAPPLEEAPWANTSCLWSDLEQAMRALPFNWEKILFVELCLGGGSDGDSNFRNGMGRHNWREKVGDFWGITGGDVRKIVDEAINELCDSLNGVAVDSSPASVA